MRKVITFSLKDSEEFKLKLLTWSQRYNHVAYFDSNNFDNNSLSYNSYQCLVAVDKLYEFDVDGMNPFKAFENLTINSKDWLFGFLGYDLKNYIEDLVSENYDGIDMPEIHFFQPRYVFIIDQANVQIAYYPDITNLDEIIKTIISINSTSVVEKSKNPNISIKQRFTKDEYISTINKIKTQIQQGNIYEMNFCQEFYSEMTEIDPLTTYWKLRKVSPAPFSCFYKVYDKYLMCASPERYLKKSNSKIISQPIKGTIERGVNEQDDRELISKLRNSKKEQSENVMIVDLVRNDLSRTAKKGSVEVEELFGIYTFPQVHQMISTVVSELDNESHFSNAIKHSFPMGSMTGAPKIKAMELIEKYERTKRGLFSGAVGYITNYGDFDFNVVIRSIQYNKSDKYLSFITGGAITINSDPEKEYEESILKAKALRQVVESF